MKMLFALLLILSVSWVRADVTLRYTSKNQFTSLLPSAIMDQVMSQRGVQLPTSLAVRLKGTKGYSQFGKIEFLTDLARQEATLLDREGKRYATAPLKEVSDRLAKSMPQMPSEAQRMLGAMRGTFQSKKTGRKDVIMGIEAEETEGVFTVAGGAAGGTPMMKMVIQFWAAKPAEVQRIGSLREFVSYGERSSAFFSPAGMIRQMTGRIAGFAEGIASMIDEMQRNKSVMLKAHMEMQMPFMARMAERMAKAGESVPEGFDPNQPFVTLDQLLVEISDAPIDDAVFQVPEGFQRAPMEELLKDLIPPAPEDAK